MIRYIFKNLYSNYLLSFLFIVLTSCKSDKINYPITAKKPVTDVYFGHKVEDNYRWLENDLSAETEEWVKKQNQTTFKYLNQIPFREDLKRRLLKLLNYEKISAPFKKGEYTYFYKNSGLLDQSILYRNLDNQEPEVFIDPNKFSPDGTTSLAGVSFSKDASLVAYSISEGGADWRKVIVINTETKELVGDTINNVKFSAISWKSNEGFYYSSYESPEGSKLSSKTDQHMLYYHKLGSRQNSDRVIFGALPSEKNRYVRGYVTDDNRFLVIDAAVKTTGNKLFIKDLSKNSALKTIVDNYDSNTSLLDNLSLIHI